MDFLKRNSIENTPCAVARRHIAGPMQTSRSFAMRLQLVEERADAVGDEGLLGGAPERRGTAEMAADGRDLDVLRILDAGIDFARQISGDGAVSLAGQITLAAF
jgi:hypothetical protein